MNKQEMLASVEKSLSLSGKVDKRILKSMEKIDRKEFVPDRLKVYAYEDNSLPIDKGQTISQPSTVARMLSLLELNKEDSVLEIGTGSGWNAALIADLVEKGKVFSLEIYDELIECARKNIKKFNLKNITIINQDFRNLTEKFDKIIFSAGIFPVQKEIIENFARKNLKDKGILICPFQSGPLIIIQKKHKEIIKKYTQDQYRFVQLKL